MKRLLSCLAALLVVLSASAQHTVADNIVWGYRLEPTFDGDDNVKAIGTGSAGNYEVGIKIPADGMFNRATISGVRLPIRSAEVITAAAVKVYGSDKKSVLTEQSVDLSLLADMSYCDVRLDNPVVMQGDAYVAFVFTTKGSSDKAKNPILYDKRTKEKESFLLKSGSSFSDYSSYYGAYILQVENVYSAFEELNPMPYIGAALLNPTGDKHKRGLYRVKPFNKQVPNRVFIINLNKFVAVVVVCKFETVIIELISNFVCGFYEVFRSRFGSEPELSADSAVCCAHSPVICKRLLEIVVHIVPVVVGADNFNTCFLCNFRQLGVSYAAASGCLSLVIAHVFQSSKRRSHFFSSFHIISYGIKLKSDFFNHTIISHSLNFGLFKPFQLHYTHFEKYCKRYY